MKVSNFGLSLEPKKYSYESPEFKKLVDKFSPKKRNPYGIEVIDGSAEAADLVVINKEKVLDFIIGDLEKLEQRLLRAESQLEKEALQQAQNYLESGKILSQCSCRQEVYSFWKNLQLNSLKPVLIRENSEFSSQELNDFFSQALEAAARILFYTASEKEVKAWGLKKGKTVLEAAGKIHSDLMRGFIRAEIVNCRVLDDFFNLAEAKSKGLVETTGKDYLVKAGDIVFIKFSV